MTTTDAPIPGERRAKRIRPERGDASHDRAALVQATADARTALHDAVAAAADAAARAHAIAALLDDTLMALAGMESAPVRAPLPTDASWHEAGALSPREKEVLALVAEGRSNKAIAAALFVSPNTVKSHVASLLHKLHADTRVQLAAIAARHDLPHRAALGA